MSSSWLRKFSLVDDAGVLLVHISPKTGDGNTLDLDLLATDGEAAFRGKSEQRSGEKARLANALKQDSAA